MKANESFFDARPSAAILVEGLRDFGYTLQTALADIIDNSLAAGATEIKIWATGARVSIVDNGRGMSKEELAQAMRPGSQSPRSKRAANDLGRFGLGLKTASFSQCRRLTVVTRSVGQTVAAAWDLDHVVATDEWHCLWVSDADVAEYPSIAEPSGTAVIWEQIDRIGDSTVNADEKAFDEQFSLAAAHLERVFHRYLQGSGVRKVNMQLNGLQLKANDPFEAKEAVVGPPHQIRFGKQLITVVPHWLPHHSRVTEQAWKRHGGREGHMASQGFYLYRGGRLVTHATWFGLQRKTALNQLTRIQIDIPTTMDEAWRINVLKSAAQPPHQVREELRNLLAGWTVPSKRAYKDRVVLPKEASRPIWRRELNGGIVQYSVDPRHPMILELLEKLDDECGQLVLTLVNAIGCSLPVESLFVDLGDRPSDVGLQAATEASIESLLKASLEGLVGLGVATDAVLEQLLAISPFRENQDLVKRRVPQLLDERTG